MLQISSEKMKLNSGDTITLLLDQFSFKVTLKRKKIEENDDTEEETDTQAEKKLQKLIEDSTSEDDEDILDELTPIPKLEESENNIQAQKEQSLLTNDSDTEEEKVLTPEFIPIVKTEEKKQEIKEEKEIVNQETTQVMEEHDPDKTQEIEENLDVTQPILSPKHETKKSGDTTDEENEPTQKIDVEPTVIMGDMDPTVLLDPTLEPPK